MAVLIGDLRREQELHFVVGSGEQERREQGGDVELGVESVREHHDEAVARRLVKSRETGGIGGEVDLEGRPLVPLPVLVERPERSRPFRQLLDLYFPTVNAHASRT